MRAADDRPLRAGRDNDMTEPGFDEMRAAAERGDDDTVVQL